MNFFLVGIKGSGMSALAIILKNLGNNVKGSDVNTAYFTEQNLIKEQIKIYEFGEYNFDEEMDYIIVGNAFDESNIDIKKVSEKNFNILTYPQALNMVANQKNSIAVAGTNGKTTTTGILKQSFLDLKPTYLIGDGTGVGIKGSKDFIFEACEYKEVFLNYTPKIGIINNIEFDHPDFFKDEAHVVEVFQKFADGCNTLIINGDDVNCKKIKHNNIITFGLDTNNDLYATKLDYDEKGIGFELVFKEESLGEFKIPFYGEYMIYNTLAAIATNLVYKRDINEVISNINTFEGVKRRFSEEILNEENNLILIDDYAHHPTAIDLTLKAIKQKYKDFKVVTLFQPHTYSRTEAFKEEFAKSLLKSDKIYLVDVFGSAREKSSDIGIEVIKDEIVKLGCEDKLIDDNFFENSEKDMIFCLLGAGDIDLLFKDKLRNLYL